MAVPEPLVQMIAQRVWTQIMWRFCWTKHLERAFSTKLTDFMASFEPSWPPATWVSEVTANANLLSFMPSPAPSSKLPSATALAVGMAIRHQASAILNECSRNTLDRDELSTHLHDVVDYLDVQAGLSERSLISMRPSQLSKRRAAISAKKLIQGLAMTMQLRNRSQLRSVVAKSMELVWGDMRRA